MKKIKIPKIFVSELLAKNTKSFPLYSTFLINQASQTAQSTRPKVVGQLSEEFPNFINEITALGKKPSLEEWKKYHKRKFPNSIQESFIKTKDMLLKFKSSLDKISDDHILKWIEDLVYEKTYFGLDLEAIVREYLFSVGHEVRKANPSEESKNIDLFMNGLPLQIKPKTIEYKQSIKSKIETIIIYYEFIENNLYLEFDETIVKI